MTDNSWVLGLIGCAMLGIFLIKTSIEDSKARRDYNQGYDDGMRDAIKIYTPNEDTQQILKILKEAYKDKIRNSEDRQKGDIKAVNEVGNINELKAVVWEQNILRKEK